MDTITIAKIRCRQIRRLLGLILDIREGTSSVLSGVHVYAKVSGQDGHGVYLMETTPEDNTTGMTLNGSTLYGHQEDVAALIANRIVARLTSHQEITDKVNSLEPRIRELRSQGRGQAADALVAYQDAAMDSASAILTGTEAE